MNDGKLCEEFDFDRIWTTGVDAYAERDGIIAQLPIAHWDMYSRSEALSEKLTEAGVPPDPKRVRNWDECAAACAFANTSSAKPTTTDPPTAAGSPAR